MGYAERLATLLAHRIGLWDVIAQAVSTVGFATARRTRLRCSWPRCRIWRRSRSTAGMPALEGGGPALGLVRLRSSSPAYSVMPISCVPGKCASVAQGEGRLEQDGQAAN